VAKTGFQGIPGHRLTRTRAGQHLNSFGLYEAANVLMSSLTPKILMSSLTPKITKIHGFTPKAFQVWISSVYICVHPWQK